MFRTTAEAEGDSKNPVKTSLRPYPPPLPLAPAGPRSAIGRAPDSCQGSWVRYPVWQHTFVSPSTFSRRAVVSYWRKYVHEVLVNRLGGLSLPRKIVVRLTDRPDMTLDVYCGRKTTIQYNPLSSTSNLLLTVPRRYFCCCSSMLHFVMSVCISSRAIWPSE